MATGNNIRVGDAEREAVAAQLRDHYADGRLTLDELNERIDQAFAARTRADLAGLTRDLPMSARPLVSSGSTWQDATSGPGFGPGAGSSGYSGQSRYSGYSGGGQGSWRPWAALAPALALFWLFLILGGMFAFGLGGGERPLAIVFFLAALAFLRRLLGGGRRRRGFVGARGRRCGRW